MAHYRNPAPTALEPELEMVRQIGAWTPPTPRWNDSSAYARVGKLAPARQQQVQASATVVERVRHRLDLIGWLLGQSGDGLMNMLEDPSDPRVIMHNRISSLTYRHNGPQGVLLRLVYVGV